MYTTTRPQFKYIYNQFAVATMVDRFTQFWRELNANLQALLLQDPYTLQFVVSYPEALDSAVNPLGDPTIYDQVKLDAASRNRQWVAGGDLLTIPTAPIVTYSTTSTPAAGQSGWQGTNFDPISYLSRPDIQQLPIPTQIAMLRTNINYAALQQTGQAISDSIQASIQQNQLLLQNFQNIGFKVEVKDTIDSVPVGTGLQVAFDQIDFDLTGNVTSPNTFTLQTSGNYAIAIELNWDAGAAGVRTATLFLNGTTALSTWSTDNVTAAPTTIQLTSAQHFNAGDVLTVVVTHGLNTAQIISPGSYIAATLTDTDTPVSTMVIPNTSVSKTQKLIAGAVISALVAVITDSNGNIEPVDPATVQTASPGAPIYPILPGVALSSGGVGTEITVGTYYGGLYNAPNANFTVGGLLYAGVGGAITQDYSTINSTCQWVVVVGRAITPTQFIFEPHIPNLQNLGTF